jgi:hypothetical protein
VHGSLNIRLDRLSVDASSTRYNRELGREIRYSVKLRISDLSFVVLKNRPGGT